MKRENKLKGTDCLNNLLLAVLNMGDYEGEKVYLIKMEDAAKIMKKTNENRDPTETDRTGKCQLHRI